MKKSHIKKLLKLEKLLEEEIAIAYCDSMLEMFPMFHYRDIPLPHKTSIVKSIEKKLFSKYSELINCLFVKHVIVKFVNKKYEVLMK